MNDRSGRERLPDRLVAGLVVIVVCSAYSLVHAVDNPCDDPPPAPTCNLCQTASVTIEGTSLGANDIVFTGIDNAHSEATIYWRPQSPCGDCNTYGGPAEFRVDGGMWFTGIENSFFGVGGELHSDVFRPPGAPVLLPGQHTLTVRARVHQGGNCANDEYEWVPSNPITFWIPSAPLLRGGISADTDGLPSGLGTKVGCPVDVVTGKMYYQKKDLRIRGPIPLEFTRRYSSFSNNADGALGFGWQHNFMIRLTDIADQSKKTFINDEMRRVTFNCADGSGAGDTFVCGGTWRSNTLDHLKLTQEAGPVWKVRNKYGLTYTFGATGKLHSIADRNGNTLTLHYQGNDDSNHLQSITDGFGRSIEIEYEATSPNRIHLVSAGDRSVTYGYDGGNLATATYSDCVGATCNSLTYTYDGTSDGTHRLESVVDALGHVVEEHSYSSDGTADLTTASDGGNNTYTIFYNEHSSPTRTVRNSRNIDTTYTVDVYRGLVTQVTGPACSSCGGGGATVTKTYDGFNLASSTDATGVTTAMPDYDSNGNVLTRIENAETTAARTTLYTYHPDFSVVTSITVPTLGTEGCEHANKVTTFEYETNGDLKSVETVGCNLGAEARQKTSYTYDAHGQVESIDGPRDNASDALDVTTFLYYPDVDDPEDEEEIPENNFGRLQSVIDAFGHETIYADYDYFGNAQIVTDPNGVVTTKTFNFKDQILTETISGTPELVTAYKYDLVGNLLRVRRPKCVAAGTGCGFSLEYEYDNVNRPKTIRDREGNEVRYSYDLVGDRIREEFQDPSSAVTRFTNFTYDSLNRLSYVYFFDDPPSSPPNDPSSTLTYFKYTYFDDGTRHTERDPENHVTTFTYDPFKRLHTTSQTVGSDTLTTTYGYDPQDNLTEVSDPRGLTTTYVNGDLGWRLSVSSPDTKETTYTYDEAGNLLTTTNADDITLTRSYDKLNRLETIEYPNTDLNVTYSYDAPGVFGIGRRTGMTDESGTTAFTYDRRGLLVSEEKVIRDWTYATGYDYDENGNVIEIRYPASNTAARQGVVDYEYDLADRVDLVTTSIDSSPVTVADGFAYKPFGPRTGLTFGNTLIDARSFDSRYQLGTWTLGSTTLGNRINYTHGFDRDSNLVTRTDGNVAGGGRTFGYDEAHRLITAAGPWCSESTCKVCSSGAQTYSYDKNGNRTCKGEAGSATNYSYGTGSNHLVTSSTGGNTDSYDYDATGNTTIDGAHTYEYSDAGRLATVDEGATATYRYDGDNRRTSKSSAEGRTYYFYDPQGRLLTEMTLGESDGSGVGKDYLYLPDAPIARVDWSVPENFGECPPGLGSGDCDPPAATAALYYYHTDHLGTPIAMTNVAGGIAWRAEHLPFGELFSNTVADVANNLRFPGQYFDEETALHQNWFRDYAPWTGRYAEADPIGLGGGLNPFSYAAQDPISHSDFRGLDAPGCDRLSGVTSPCLLKACALHDQCYREHHCSEGSMPGKCPKSRCDRSVACFACNEMVAGLFAACNSPGGGGAALGGATPIPLYYCAAQARFIEIPRDFPDLASAIAVCEHDDSKDCELPPLPRRSITFPLPLFGAVNIQWPR